MLLFFAVLSLNVTIAVDQNSSIKSIGTNFTLTCITELPPAVDSNVTLSINWTGPAGDALPGSRSSLLMTGIPTRYQNTLIVNRVNASQFGNYSCTATVNSDPPSIFIATSEGSATLTVIGKTILFSYLHLHFICMKFLRVQNSNDWGKSDQTTRLASFPDLPRFYLPFAFAIIHEI